MMVGVADAMSVIIPPIAKRNGEAVELPEESFVVAKVVV